MHLPFSQACENNKDPILAVLRRHLTAGQQVFEVGSGTGQHAVHFAQALAHVRWQCADLPENLAAIAARLEASGLQNLPAPIAFDLEHPQWPSTADAVFTANTLHIVTWKLALRLVEQAGLTLPPEGKLFIYGPFKYNGLFTTKSNAQFDEWLKMQAPWRGIRDFEAIEKHANSAGMTLLEDNAMPANNQLLVFIKTGRP